MSYYDLGGRFEPSRQASWEQSLPSRSGPYSQEEREDSWDITGATSGSGNGREEITAFASQMEEVDRAVENLARSGKLMNMGMPYRRDSVASRPPRREQGYGSPRHPMDFNPTRSDSTSHLQSFYATQRNQPRGGDPADLQQAKRRMAAQRERELRNYHQEQQYNRSKPERSMSPNMSEEERRELIARQHRALYGSEGYEGTNNGSNAFGSEGQMSGGRGASPMVYPFSGQEQQQSKASEEAGKGSSPTAQGHSPPTTSGGQSYGAFEQNGQQARPSTSSPQDGNSPPRHKASGSVAPIGTRPAQGQIGSGLGGNSNNGVSARKTPPAASPLNYGFGESGNERAASAAGKESMAGSVSWGSGTGVWGKNPLGVQASVWG